MKSNPRSTITRHPDRLIVLLAALIAGLAALVPAGVALIARTESGLLLRFDPETLRPTRRWSGSVAATCLNRWENGTVLAGFADEPGTGAVLVDSWGVSPLFPSVPYLPNCPLHSGAPASHEPILRAVKLGPPGRFFASNRVRNRLFLERLNGREGAEGRPSRVA